MSAPARRPRYVLMSVRAVLALFVFMLLPPRGAASAGGTTVGLAQVVLHSFPAPTRVRALESLAAELLERTSVEADRRARVVSVLARERFDFPLLFLPCNAGIPALRAEEETALAVWLKMGGTLVVDWQGTGRGLEEFRSSVEVFLSTLLPGTALERIPLSSVVYRSFYRLHRATGRVQLVDDLYGVMVDGRYVALVSFNDILSSVERTPSGEFRYEVVPGGDEQREEAVRLLVNLVVYALCQDYKDDKVHLDYLKSKRNWRLPGEE